MLISIITKQALASNSTEGIDSRSCLPEMAVASGFFDCGVDTDFEN